MGFLSRLFGREDAAKTDAQRVYAKLMRQSRTPEFYGNGRMPDSYDGRIDVLTIHIAAVLSNLNRFEKNGETLGQALFDEMKDDFEIALREEALSDASVKKRIQPMISLFYDRVKRYAEALNQPEPVAAVESEFTDILTQIDEVGGPDSNSATFAGPLTAYLVAFDKGLQPLSLGQIALTEFDFPTLDA